jgi:hypothetical protein
MKGATVESSSASERCIVGKIVLVTEFGKMNRPSEGFQSYSQPRSCSLGDLWVLEYSGRRDRTTPEQPFGNYRWVAAES